MSYSERTMPCVFSHLWFLPPNLQAGEYCQNIIEGMTHSEERLGNCEIDSGGKRQMAFYLKCILFPGLLLDMFS